MKANFDIIEINLNADDSKQIAKIGELTLHKYSIGCTMNQNYIFIIGGRILGNNYKKQELNTVEALDINTKKIFQIPDLNFVRANAIALVHNNYLYVVSNKEPKIEKISVENMDSINANHFEILEVKITMTENLGFVSHKNDIYCFNQTGIEKIINDEECEEIIKFSEEKSIPKSEIWNQSIMPFSSRNCLHFFGTENFVRYSIERNEYDIITYKSLEDLAT